VREGKGRGGKGERKGKRGGRRRRREGRSLPYQSKNRSRAPDCLCIAAVHGRCHRPMLLFVTLFQTRYCSADKCTNGPRQERSRVPGMKVPWNEWSRERMFQGTNRLENQSSRERTVQGMNVLRNEWSRERKFHHGNECSRERIVLGTNIPDTTEYAILERF